MGLLDKLTDSKFGFKGEKPTFKVAPNPPASRHQTYSINGDPDIRLVGSNPLPFKPEPSLLDLNGVRPKAYMDNPPK